MIVLRNKEPELEQREFGFFTTKIKRPIQAKIGNARVKAAKKLFEKERALEQENLEILKKIQEKDKQKNSRTKELNKKLKQEALNRDATVIRGETILSGAGGGGSLLKKGNVALIDRARNSKINKIKDFVKDVPINSKAFRIVRDNKKML